MSSESRHAGRNACTDTIVVVDNAVQPVQGSLRRGNEGHGHLR